MDVIAYLERERKIRLSARQQEAVRSENRRTLLLAVPGSGKTTVLAARLAHLIHERGVEPRRMLNLTFSRETAGEMARRYETLFGALSREGSVPGASPRFATIHSFCMVLLRRYAAVYRRTMPRLLAEDGGLRTRALRELYRKHTGEFLPDDLLDTLENQIGCAKNRMIPPDELREFCVEPSSFPEIFTEYEAWKRGNGLMDFDDMLTFTWDVLQKCPPIREEFLGRYDEISVDEAQDSSLVQHRILGVLAQRAGLFLVGDEDQSIYAFRGASPEALLGFERDYPGAMVLKLEENFRSRQEIVAAADCFIRLNQGRYEKHMTTPNPSGGKLEMERLADYGEQYERVYERLRGIPPGQTAAVLYRNNESALPLIRLFYERGGSFATRERKYSYFTCGVIRDITNYLILADDPGDAEAFARIAYKLGFKKGIADQVREHGREYGGVFDCVLAIPTLRRKQRERTEEYRELFPRLVRMRPEEAIGFLYDELGYGEFIGKLALGSVNAMQKLNAARCLARGAADIYDFLDQLEALRQDVEAGRQMDPSAPVLLSTIHSAKGMEFDTVFLLDLLDGILPGEERDAIEDERRLFYVGVTRAKERVVLFESNRMNGEPAYASPFLRQLTQPKSKR